MDSFVYELRNAMNMLGHGSSTSNSASACVGALRPRVPTSRDLAPVPTPVPSLLAPNASERMLGRARPVDLLPIAILDRDGVIITANRPFRECLGDAQADAEGTRFSESSLASVWNQFGKDLAAAGAGEPVVRRVDMPRADGLVSPKRASLDPAPLTGFILLTLAPMVS